MFALSLIVKEERLSLHAVELPLPLRGCMRPPAESLPNGHSLERLELILQGSPGQARAFVQWLQTLLERIRLGATSGVGTAKRSARRTGAQPRIRRAFQLD